jgi:alkylation response protein AidB-like acyl-CoA dehydrogenase
VDFRLAPVQEQLRSEVASLARRFDADYWLDKDRKAEYPWEFVQAFAERGWLGLVIPEEYGGAGLGVTEAALLLHEVCASGAGTSGASAIHFYMFPQFPIIRFGSVEMKRKHLPAMARGELLTAFGVTEPSAGSDTSRIQTRAVRSDGGWRISGQKVWTTNAQNAQKILLLARTEARDDARPFDGLTLFFTDLDRGACTIRRIEKLGRAAVDSNEVFIEGLRASDDDVVGEVGKGFKHLLEGLNPERIVVAAEAVGIGRAALAIASRYAQDRVVFDRPIGRNQAVAHPLAEAWAELEAAELLTLKAAWLFDQGQPCGREANAAKVLAAEAGFKAADASLQTLGGFGYAKEYHVERLWREVRLYKIAPVSQQMALNYIAQRVLGLPRSY